jgi:hypothetical protein
MGFLGSGNQIIKYCLAESKKLCLFFCFLYMGKIPFIYNSNVSDMMSIHINLETKTNKNVQVLKISTCDPTIHMCKA